MSASPQRQLPHAPSVSLNGRQVPYVTVENPRRKSISIYWTGRIEVRCPPGTTKRRVEAVLREHADWVLAHLPAEGVPASRYCDGGVIPYRGGRAVLVLGQERSVIMKVGDRTEVWLKVPKGADEGVVKMALAVVLKKYAWRIINDCWMRVIETAPKLPGCLAVVERQNKVGQLHITRYDTFVLAPDRSARYRDRICGCP